MKPANVLPKKTIPESLNKKENPKITASVHKCTTAVPAKSTEFCHELDDTTSCSSRYFHKMPTSFRGETLSKHGPQSLEVNQNLARYVIWGDSALVSHLKCGITLKPGLQSVRRRT